MKDNDSRVVAEILDVLGVEPGDAVVIETPQHTRAPGAPSPGNWVPEESDWPGLSNLSIADLTTLGFGSWDGAGLMLIPGEWHSRLPVGLELVCIDGTHAVVGTDYIDDDIRYGCLAYGIMARRHTGREDER